MNKKVILLISPQAWGKMYLSKHHYAIALAKQGNEVYFLNPPQEKKSKGSIEIVKSDIEKKLFLINHSIAFSYKIKFHWVGLFHYLMKCHICEIEKKIYKKIDLIINFDLGNYYPFKYFEKNSKKIFFPIDEPLDKTAINSGNSCDILISVTNEIIDKYEHLSVPKYFTHHGLSDVFIDSAIEFTKINDGKIHVGLSGNWLRNDIDREILLRIINENIDIVFEFWGSYKEKDSNIGGSDKIEIVEFIETLQKSKNVILHGAVNPKKLALEYRRMDAFLICYDILKDQSKGTNYHKVMEFLSTGKVIISNNISTYKNLDNLIEMTDSRNHNKLLPELFKSIIDNLESKNNFEVTSSRIAFAKTNLYSEKAIFITTL